MGDVAAKSGPAPGEPVVGAIYSFKTRPYCQFSAPDTGRYAAFKVIHASDDVVALAVLDGVWTAPPTERDVRGRTVLRNRRFSHTGRPAMIGMNPDWFDVAELQAAVFLGIEPLSDEERPLGERYASRAMGISYSTIDSVDIEAECEWRWAHDREQFVAECEQKTALRDAERAAREERYRTRLKGLTFDTLLSETPFERWSPSPPFPPAEFRDAARARVHDLCRELRALGAKPGKAATRKALKQCVQWFNAEDDKAGGVIETEEREDICRVLEEVAHAARQPALADEIDQWRDW